MRHVLPSFSPWLAVLLVPLACGHDRASVSPIVVPGAPEAVQATAGDAAVAVQWAAATNAASYCVYYAASPDVSPANWSTLPDGHRMVPVTSPLLVGGLANGTTYTFVVTAWNAAGDRESAPSAAVQATPNAVVPPGWTTPVTMPAYGVASTTASLAGHITNPDGYTTSLWFEYGTSTAYGASTPPQQFAAAGPIEIITPVGGLTPSTTYHYRLVSENTGGRFAGADVSFATLAEPQVLLGNLDGPSSLCHDGAFVYFFEIYAGRLRRVDPGTGAATTLANVGAHGNTGNVAVLGSTVWFSDAINLYRVGVDGTGLSVVGPYQEISELFAHSTGLHIRHGQSLTWMSLDGTLSITFYVRTPIGSESFSGGIAADSTHLYWTDYWTGTVEKLAFAGGQRVVLAVGQNHPHRLWREGDTLWFAADDGLRRVATTGGAVTTVSAATGDFTKIGDVFYVATTTDVLRVAATTGAATVLTTGGNITGRPVVTDTRILWLRRGDHWYPPLGALLWIPRP